MRTARRIILPTDARTPMNPMNWLAGGAIVGVLAGCWDKIKALTWKLVSLFIQQVEIPSEAAHQALIAHLIEHFPRSRFYARMYGASYEHHRDGRYGLVPYELFGTRALVFWNRCWPFVFTNQLENKKPAAAPANPWGGSSDDGTTKVYSTLTFLRGTLDIEAIRVHSLFGVMQLRRNTLQMVEVAALAA